MPRQNSAMTQSDFLNSSIPLQLLSAAMAQALTTLDLQGALPLVARGKVRDLYEVDEKTLLFVATDRISAYDVIMENVSVATPINSLSAID